MLIYRINKTPIVFVPGLFGSMSDFIIPGTGNWSFGIAGMAYQPFILILESMGYQRNLNLFICFYDWRQRITQSAQNYLVEKIKEAKLKTGSNKVNLVCHSMGGLVARSYVQSESYLHDVDKIILLCTPNAGSAPNYSFWTGGELPVNLSPKINFVYYYMDMYIQYLSKRYKLGKIEAIHTHFKGLQDIISSENYGNYLIMENGHSREFVPYQTMKTKNKFLDQLNKHRDIIKKRNIDVTLIAGVEEETILYLQVIPSKSSTMWVDGKVVGACNTKSGDGNVVLNSAFSLDGEKYMLQGTHIGILYKSEAILRKKLQC